MGTTLVALAMTTDTGAVAAHAGDSRLYRLRRGRLEQLTNDHTVVAEALRAGEIDQTQAEDHPHRSVLTRAVGVGPDFDVDYGGVNCAGGDRFLLASDGLFKALSHGDIRDVLAVPAEPQETADRLIAEAAQRKAAGDLTVLVVDVRS